jgi:ABC-type multidrug transport system ATPase subunit
MIEIKDLHFGYQKNKLLFSGLNLKLTKGHIYGLLGKNGAGKSTLLKNIAGLAFPLKGFCFFNGMNVSNRPVSVLEDIYFLAEELFVPDLTPDRCIVISTHQVRDLDSLIDTLLVLHGGEIVINQSIDDVIEKITFGSYPDTEDLPVLYEENGPRGKNAILKNTTGEYSKVDLEILFNAIIADNQPVLKTLNASVNE